MSKALAAVLLTNLLATWFLVGLIWVVQIVHYPMFQRISPEQWQSCHREHARMITALVAPSMFIEALSAAALVFMARDLPPGLKACVWVAGGLVLVNWFSTVGVQVPLHNRLSEQYDPAAAARLLATNWVRTIAWTLRGALLAAVTWNLWR